MGIPIDVVGLSKFISEIPDGNIVLIEGRIDPIKAYFAQLIGCTAFSNGREIIYVTSRVPKEIQEELTFYNYNPKTFNIISEKSARHWKDFIKMNTVLIIDSFSYLMLDKELYEFRHIMEELRERCKEKNAIVLLTLEDDMLDEKQEITAEYLADGIIRFRSKDISKGIQRYLYIPKWMDCVSFDDNIYYTFDGKKMKVDLRSRVV